MKMARKEGRNGANTGRKKEGANTVLARAASAWVLASSFS